MKPFFSIIVPCCDVEPYVRESLDSVANQPFADWECLIGVETSKDKTEEIVREYVAKDSRFKVFTGPRSGSCSASRNTGIDMATGEYVIFLDGDDTIAEGSLQRLHDKIAAHPGADLYPCAMQVYDDASGKELERRDNYPADFGSELTGPAATVMLGNLLFYPCPMLQLTVFRRQFLVDSNLKCVHGLRNQDSEFSPRALYLARRVVPLHEPFYLYRIRTGSVQTAASGRGRGYFYRDWKVILKSLFAFHAVSSKEQGFDRRVAEAWSRTWLSTLFIKWFSKDFVENVPRQERLDSLKAIFADGLADFDGILRAASRPKRIAGWWVKVFVRHPAMRWLAERFFVWLYFPMTSLKGGK
jgi:glycosyltransferase involved in cell wall biosynthesis